MWATLALSSVLMLAPAQGGALATKNARATYGPLGQERNDPKVLPGDVYWLSFDIVGLKMDTSGNVRYTMSVVLENASGMALFRGKPQPIEMTDSLGANSIPAFAKAEVGLDTPAGTYTLTVNIEDNASKATTKVSQKFDVIAKDFGIVQPSLVLYTNQDTGLNLWAPPTGTRGQAYYAKFFIVGFMTDKNNKEEKVDKTDLLMEWQIIDEATGKPILKPFTGKTTRIPQGAQALDGILPITLTKAGKYKVVIKVTDQLARPKKSAEQTLSLTVLER